MNFLYRLTFSILDLEDVSQLPETYKADLPHGILAKLAIEFHSASYHPLLEVLTALRTVIKHLTKSLKESAKGLDKMSILDFMREIYRSMESDHVFYNIGIQSAASSQLKCLAKVPLTSAFKCFKFFFQRVDEGYYDFSNLPLILKKTFPATTEETIAALDSKNPTELLVGLQQLVDILKDSEQDIIKCAQKSADVSDC